MRTVIAIAALAFTAVGAHAAEDRYGPPPAARALVVASVAGQAQAAQSLAPKPYAGRMLSWTGKTAPRAIEAEPAPIQAAPQPASSRAPMTPPPPLAARPAVSFQPQAQRIAPPQQAAALPGNLYDQPMAPSTAAPTYIPRPTVQPAPPPEPRPAAQVQTRPQPQPQAQAQTVQAPRSPAPARALSAPASGNSVRSYSVLREFGGQPDPITLPPPTSYWATRQQAEPAQLVGMDDVAGEIQVAGGVGEDPDAAPRPERKREIKRETKK